MNKYFLFCVLFFLVQSSFSQTFKSSNEYRDFFNADLEKLASADKLKTKGDSLMIIVRVRNSEIEELKLSSQSSNEKKIKVKEVEVFDLQVNAYENFAKSNSIRYKIYDKYFRIYWKNATDKDYLKRNTVRYKAKCDFDRASEIRNWTPAIVSNRKITWLYRIDSLEVIGLQTMENCLSSFLLPAKVDTTQRTFSETNDFKELLKQQNFSYTQFQQADRNTVLGDSVLTYGSFLQARNKDQVGLMNDISGFFKKRSLKKEIESSSKAMQGKTDEAYKYYNSGNDSKRTFYTNLINSLRPKISPQTIANGISFEDKSRKNWERATNARLIAQALANEKRIDSLKSGYKSELASLKNLEDLLKYYTENPTSVGGGTPVDTLFVPRTDWQEIKSRFEKLNANCSEIWVKEVILCHKDIDDYQDQLSKTTNKDQQKFYKDFIYKQEIKESAVLNRVETTYEKQNEEDFELYKKRIASLGELNTSAARYQEGADLEKEIIEHFRKAKQNIYRARYINDLMALKLVKKDDVSAYENFSTNQIVSYMCNKYEAENLLMSACEEERKGVLKSGSLYNLYKESRLTKGKNEKENSKMAGAKKEKVSTKKEKEKSTEESLNLHFRVQIATFDKKQALKSFKGYKKTELVEEILNDGVAYLTEKSSHDQAESNLKKAKDKGYKDAFVVAYQNGKRIALYEALEQIQTYNTKHQVAVNKPLTSTKNVEKDTITKSIRVDKKLANLTVDATDLKMVKSLLYTVQVGTFDKDTKWSEIGCLTPVYKEEVTSGIYRYTVGSFSTENQALKARQEVVKAGVKDAFVVAYKDGERISLDQVAKLKTTKKTEKDSKKETNVSKEELKTKASKESNAKYSIQIAAGSDEPSVAEKKRFKELEKYGKLSNFKNNKGITIYTIGEFTSFKEAEEVRKNIAKAGEKDVFVIELKGEKSKK